MEYQSFKMFDLVTEKVVKGLRVADCMNFQNFFNDATDKDENPVLYNLKELVVSDVLTCSYCNISFANAFDQRSHYKLDWHRYNLKRALSGNKSVPEEIFDTLADDISSISGSDNESSGNDNDEDPESSKPVQSSENEKISCNFKKIRHAKAFFENDENQILSVYKCLLHNKKDTPGKDELVRSLDELIQSPQKWIIIMLGGGHFASAIFSKGEVLNHKTFHSYTVRAKQGGSQSAKDSKGGHPKSAGASLRRYNEQALIQHVQEILGGWSETIKQCSLILYRATGPYNRGVLFGGKNPILSKNDPRLRNIPFPTRRATFKEVKRVYDMLSIIEIYGSADHFKDKFPSSPDKRTWSPKSKAEETDSLVKTDRKSILKNKRSPKICRDKERSPPQRELPSCIASSSESECEDENNFELFSDEITMSFGELREFEDTVPQRIKNLRSRLQKEKKRKKNKQKSKADKEKFNSEVDNIQEKLVKSCLNEDKELLIETLKIYENLPEKDCIELRDTQTPSSTFTKEDFIKCLNTPVEKENKSTLLHLAAQKCLPEFITLLLLAGADPTVRNKNKLTPYVIADKNTRDSFRVFAASFPDKYDFKSANIPEPLNAEQAKELEEKKKERKKLKRMKEKIKKQEDREKKNEEKEREKFLALSDKEKCALAAERRLIASASGKPLVLSRCFQCGTDLTGIVAFEYNNNRFCTIPCLKAHRLKTNSYGKEL